MIVIVRDDKRLARSGEVRYLRTAQAVEGLACWTKVETNLRGRYGVVAADDELKWIVSVIICSSQPGLRSAERDHDAGQRDAVLSYLAADGVKRRIAGEGSKVQNLIAVEIIESLARGRHGEVRRRGANCVVSSFTQLWKLVGAIAIRQHVGQGRAIIQHNFHPA